MAYCERHYSWYVQNEIVRLLGGLPARSAYHAALGIVWLEEISFHLVSVAVIAHPTVSGPMHAHVTTDHNGQDSPC